MWTVACLQGHGLVWGAATVPRGHLLNLDACHIAGVTAGARGVELCHSVRVFRQADDVANSSKPLLIK